MTSTLRPVVRRLHRLATTAAVAGVLINAMTSCTREIGDRELLFPQRHPVQAEQPGRRNIAIPLENGESLRGWHLYDASRRITLLYWYGNGETVLTSRHRLDWLTEELGVNVVAIDYRGYGFSDGEASVRAVVEDAPRVYDFVRDQLGIDTVVAYGRSLGTVPALSVAAERPVRGLILEAPFPTLQAVVAAWQASVPAPVRWFTRLRPAPELKEAGRQPIDLIRSFEGPLLIFHGTEDQTIPPRLGREMFDASASEDKHWLTVRGSGHNDLSLAQPEVAEELKQFLMRRNFGDKRNRRPE